MDTKDIDKLFSACDDGDKGYLTKDEFHELCSELSLEENELVELFNSVDMNRDGKIEKSEFMDRFHVVADRVFEVLEQNSKPNEHSFNDDLTNLEIRTSTPNDGQMLRHAKQTSWDDFAGRVGHIIYALPSYESICALYKLLTEQNRPVLLQDFEKMLGSLLRDVQMLQGSITELESSLARVTEQSGEQLSLLEEEMEAQIKIKEERARSDEFQRCEKKASHERQQYQKQIETLQEAVNKLKQVDDKLSGASPFEKEMENLREKIRGLTAENSTLRTKLNEADTNVILLRSQISALNVDLQEKKLEYDRENEAVTMAMSEQENMSRQVNSLFTDNRRLRDSNDDLREALDSNIATFRRMSSRFSRSPSASVIGEFSPYSSAHGSSRNGLLSGRSSRNSFLDLEALAECDPGLRDMTSYDVDDDTELDVSLKSSLDGASVLRANTAFERDSGVGTIKDDPDSELEWDHARGSRHRDPASNRSTSSMQSFRNSGRNSRRYRGKSKSRIAVDDISADDVSDDDTSTPSEKRSKLARRKKVVVTPDVLPSKGRLYKVILCGDANVGKSSFILRLCRNDFKCHTRSTLGVDFQLKNIHLNEGRTISLQLWDTAGQERFRSIATSYFRKSDGVILLYDVTCPESFLNVRDWMETISDAVPEGTPVIICGNKVDMRMQEDDGKNSIVFPTEGAQLAANYGVLFIETSASSGANVLTAVTLLARHLANDVTEDNQIGSVKDLHGMTLKESSCCP